jgi:hypothetical protein
MSLDNGKYALEQKLISGYESLPYSNLSSPMPIIANHTGFFSPTLTCYVSYLHGIKTSVLKL